MMCSADSVANCGSGAIGAGEDRPGSAGVAGVLAVAMDPGLEGT